MPQPYNELAVEFGGFVRNRRTELKISLRELERQSGISRTYLSLVERGIFGPPSVDFIKRIAVVLGEDTDKMLALAKQIDADVLDYISKNYETVLPAIRKMMNGQAST